MIANFAEIPASTLPVRCDIAVIGSGPAGSAAAAVLAKTGLHVVIVEKARLPRYKTCGGGVLGRVARLLGEDSIPVAEVACRTAQFAVSDRLQFSASRLEPIVWMTMRDTFDAWLTQRAAHAGARLRSECTLSDLTVSTDDVRLSTTTGDLRASYVIAADGANGITAGKAGWPDHRRLVPALECEVAVPPEDFARLGTSARFDFHPIEHGYAWVFPKRSHLSIGVLTLMPARVNLNHAFQQYLEYLGISSPTMIHRSGFVIPLSPRDRLLARGRVLLTGDAAGLADPVTAEGITHAIHSGQLAGRAIAEMFARPADVCDRYGQLLEDHILCELRWARRLARLLYGPSALRETVFRLQGQRLTEAMTDIVCGNSSYSELMTSPASYVKLLVGGSPVRPK